MSAAAKRKIIEALDSLPEQSLAAVAEFVESLRAKVVAGPAAPPSSRTDERRPYGLAAGEFVTPDDFNGPLPAEILDAF